MTILRGITWEHSRGYDCLVAASAAYEQSHPDVKLQWEARSLQAFADAPLAQLSAAYDLLVIDHPHIPLAVRAGLLVPLDGAGFDAELAVLASQSVGRSHASYTHDGHQYALATDAAAQVAVYRPDLIGAPPKDWIEVMALAGEGRVLWPAKPIDAYSSLVTVAVGNGTPPASQEGHFLSEEYMLPVLEQLHRLAELVPEENLFQNPIQIAEMLSSSDKWVYAPLVFGYTNYSRPRFRSRRLKYINIPASAMGVCGSLLGGAGIAVSSSAHNVNQARAFAFWVASANVQKGVYYTAGGQPGNALAWDDPHTNADSLDFFSGTRSTVENAYLRPRYAGYIEFQDRASRWVNQALQRQLNDRELVRRMNNAAEELLTGE